MKAFWRIPLISRLVFSVWRLDADRKCNWVEEFIGEEAHLLEVGSGPGSVVEALRKRDYKVTALDINDSSFTDDLVPVVYDGTVMPFPDKIFDIALILTTLHHTHDPEQIIREAARVAHKIIIIEDIYTTPLQRILTKITDSLTNLEVFGHPHNNRDDIGWRKCFEALGLKLLATNQKPIAGYFLQALYVLDALDREKG